MAPFLKSVFKIDLKDDVLGSDGVNWGTIDFEGPEGEYPPIQNPHWQRERCNERHRRSSPLRTGSKRAESVRLPLQERSRAAVRRGRHVQNHGFPFRLAVTNQEESLVTVRFYVPQSASEDVNEKDDTAAHRLQKQILERAVLVNNNGNMIAEIDDRLGQFVTPRGRYMMEFYDNYMRMNGNNYTYKIL